VTFYVVERIATGRRKKEVPASPATEKSREGTV